MKNDISPQNGDHIVVWVSYGAASAVAASETLRKYGDRCRISLINNPVIEEDSDNIRFGKDLEKWLRHPIICHINPEWPNASAQEVWDKRKAMSFPHGAPCTVALKKEARQDYESHNHVDWHVLGFTADEHKRYERFVLTERSNVIPILIEANLTKLDCARILIENGISLPRVYKEGYPNANCIGCVKATSPTYWNLVRKTRPEVFKQRAVQSRALGVRLVRHKGERIFLDELPEDIQGRPLKQLDFECGVFCEERIQEDVEKT